ncbi:hypothetical protein [Haloferax sp. DFSO52]|uniref:hypothetical protein n=1 Tax=Haloferax sp. DFSO52 TaxID=3388505 RepID=UPI003A855915
MPRVYDKLVRDDIPRIIRESGETPVVHTASDEEFAESGRIEELADVFAVVDAVLDRRPESWEGVETMANEKAAERGGFEDGIVLERVE